MSILARTLWRACAAFCAVMLVGACGGSGSATGAAGNGGTPGITSCARGGNLGGGEISLTNLSVTATLVDETGAPAANVITWICGIDICSAPSHSDANGKVFLQYAGGEKRPAFKFGDSISHALLTAELKSASTDFTTGGLVLATPKLADKPGAPLNPGTAAKSGDVTLTLAAQAVVTLDGLSYSTPETQQFRAAAVPLAQAGPVVASAGAGITFSAFYAVTPLATTFCPPAQVTVALPHKTSTTPNDFGWAAGAHVEFWVTSSEAFQSISPYAGWRKLSLGTVAADGLSVSTLPEQGFPVLANFALRQAP